MTILLYPMIIGLSHDDWIFYDIIGFMKFYEALLLISMYYYIFIIEYDRISYYC